MDNGLSFGKFLQTVRYYKSTEERKKQYIEKIDAFYNQIYNASDQVTCIKAVFETKKDDGSIEYSDPYIWYVPKDRLRAKFEDGDYIVVQTDSTTSVVKMVGDTYFMSKEKHLANMHPYSMVVGTEQELNRQKNFKKVYELFFKNSSDISYTSDEDVKFIIEEINKLPEDCIIFLLPTTYLGNVGDGCRIPCKVGPYKYTDDAPTILVSVFRRWVAGTRNEIILEYYLQESQGSEPVQILKGFTSPLAFETLYKYLKENPL